LSVVLGRGTRYLGLAGLGLAYRVPGPWIAVGSLVVLALGIRAARRMNQSGDSMASLPGVAEEA
ncbi:MAG: hypothetical protein ACJ8AV_14690, partial [Gemmatimonadales bacterium]